MTAGWHGKAVHQGQPWQRKLKLKPKLLLAMAAARAALAQELRRGSMQLGLRCRWGDLRCHAASHSPWGAGGAVARHAGKAGGA